MKNNLNRSEHPDQVKDCRTEDEAEREEHDGGTLHDDYRTFSRFDHDRSSFGLNHLLGTNLRSIQICEITMVDRLEYALSILRFEKYSIRLFQKRNV